MEEKRDDTDHRKKINELIREIKRQMGVEDYDSIEIDPLTGQPIPAEAPADVQQPIPPCNAPDTVNEHASVETQADTAEVTDADVMEEIESNKLATESIPAEEIAKHLEGNFTSNEVRQFLGVGEALAAHAVIDCLRRNLIEVGEKTLAEIIARTTPTNPHGDISIEFMETRNKLHLKLTPCPRGYKTDVSIPSLAYADQLYAQYNFLKSTAIAWWEQYKRKYPRVVKRAIRALRVDTLPLVIDPESPTTMYLVPDAATRVGIFAFYVAPDGKQYIKRRK